MKVAALLAALWALGCSTVTTLVRTGSAIRTRHGDKFDLFQARSPVLVLGLGADEHGQGSAHHVVGYDRRQVAHKIGAARAQAVAHHSPAEY